MNPSFAPDEIYAHYERFLGKPAQVFELRVRQFEPITHLRYETPTREGLATIGLSRYFSPAVELVSVRVKGQPSTEDVLLGCLLRLVERNETIDAIDIGTYVNFAKVDPAFVDATGKSGFIFALPSWLPDDFNPVCATLPPVSILDAIFLSTSEVAHVKSHGWKSLFALFVEAQPNTFDLLRQPVV
jgi:hypothetical protein